MIEYSFKCIDICWVPLEVLKIEAKCCGIQQLPWGLLNVDAIKTMFDPYITGMFSFAGMLKPWTLNIFISYKIKVVRW